LKRKGKEHTNDHHTERPIDVEPIDRPSTPRADGHRGAWAVLITGLALFMASLDNLVVTTALPVIRVTSTPGSRASSGRSTPTP